jgi:transposase
MVAPFVLDGPMNATTFLAHLQQYLVPTLKPADLVIMDNLPVHKAPGVREMIEAAGAMCFIFRRTHQISTQSSRPSAN